MSLASESAILFLLRLLGCFVLGSIPFAVLAMFGTGIDIRKVGSGNPGFNNVLRVSKSRAILTLIGDLGKGALAVWLFCKSGDPTLAWLCGFAAVLGHCYSPFLGFNGGKGVATSAGVMLMLYPKRAAIALAVFVLLRVTGSKLKWKEAGAIASIGGWIFFSAITGMLYAVVMTLFLIWRHKQNFQNLLTSAKSDKWRVASGE